jgi:pimeloyl-ACP methyl ester carboxylesterase
MSQRQKGTRGSLVRILGFSQSDRMSELERAHSCPRHPGGDAKTAKNDGALVESRADRFVRTLGSVTACDLGILALVCVIGLAALLCSGCVAPIRADRVTTRQAYAQVQANALRTGKPSASTVAVLHRFNLDQMANRKPTEAVRLLHQKALATGERDLLFAMAELSHMAGDRLRRGVRPGESREASDFYLGSAVYAWLFLFGEGRDPAPSAFDSRFRDACDLYNYCLGLALLENLNTNGWVKLEDARRRLPVGEIHLQLIREQFLSPIEDYERILLADHFRVRGLSVRNREPGLGAPLVCVRPWNPDLGIRQCAPATVLMRGPDSLAALGSSSNVCSLELYSSFGVSTVAVGGAQVPLEIDLTTYRAFALGGSKIWKLGKLQFLAPAERIPSQLMQNEPFVPDRIPIVFVHGTFSSPVTWAEMANTLSADPVLRQRYQIWSFLYGSGNPLVQSVSEFRSALTDEMRRCDPESTNTILRQMVIIGHSQGGLLTKSTAIDSGDQVWRVFNTNRIDDLVINDKRRAELRRTFFLEPLPFVKRVVFIATPHRGSYLSSSFARRLAQRMVSLPSALMARGTDLLELSEGSEAGHFLRGRIPTSLDGMSPKNPALLSMAEIPVTPSVKAHSIIPVAGNGDYRKGRDGVVSYQSAHVDYVQSEYIVHGKHTCLNDPATIEEVRRILHEHLQTLDPK